MTESISMQEQELERLCREIDLFRKAKPQTRLHLPKRLKKRFVDLLISGFPIGRANEVTGVEKATLRGWLLKSRKSLNAAKGKNSMQKSFKQIRVASSILPPRNKDRGTESSVMISFKNGKITLKAKVESLSPELVRMLAEC